MLRSIVLDWILMIYRNWSLKQYLRSILDKSAYIIPKSSGIFVNFQKVRSRKTLLIMSAEYSNFNNLIFLFLLWKYRDFRPYECLLYDPASALIDQKPMFYQRMRHGKSVFYCFARVKSIFQSKWRSLRRVLHCDKPLRSFENTREM